MGSFCLESEMNLTATGESVLNRWWHVLASGVRCVFTLQLPAKFFFSFQSVCLRSLTRNQIGFYYVTVVGR